MPFTYELTGCIELNSKEYHTRWEHARHGGFQNFDVEHLTDSQRPLDQPPGTTPETDENEDRLALGTSEL